MHYFVKESGVTEPIHKHRAANWPKVHRFIDESGFQAFSDHPTRMFYRELGTAYPDAWFILTVRKELAKWRQSMSTLLTDKTADIDLLQAYYLCYNEEIRCHFTDLNFRFIEICIEDDATANSRKLSNFLGLAWSGPLLRLNTSSEMLRWNAENGRPEADDAAFEKVSASLDR